MPTTISYTCRHCWDYEYVSFWRVRYDPASDTFYVKCMVCQTPVDVDSQRVPPYHKERAVKKATKPGFWRRLISWRRSAIVS